MKSATSAVADTRAIVPFALAGALLGAVTTAAIFAPQSVRGPATLAAAAVVLLLAYLRWPKPTLLVFVLFVLFYDTLGRWLSPSLEQIDEVMVPVFVLLAAWRLRPWRRGLIEPVREGSVVALLVLSVASSVVNGVPIGLWLLALMLMAKVIAFFYVALWHDFTLDDVRQFAPLVLGVGVLVLSLGAFELIDPDGFRSTLNLTNLSEPRGQLPSIKSLFYHPILFSWFTAFLALFLFAFYVVYRRWWLLLAALVFGLGTILGARRRTIAGAAMALAVGLLNQVRFGRRATGTLRSWLPVAGMVILVVVLFLPGLAGLYQLTISQTTPGQLPEGTDQEARIALYVTSAEIARDYFPLGAGLGRFGSPVSRIEYSPLYERYGLDQIVGLGTQQTNFITDTFWPRILGETGVFGLAAYLLFAGWLTVAVWRAAGRSLDADPYLRAFTLGTLMVLAEAWIETLASSMFDSPPRVYLLFGAVGVCLALQRTRVALPLSGGARTRAGSDPPADA